MTASSVSHPMTDPFETFHRARMAFPFEGKKGELPVIGPSIDCVTSPGELQERSDFPRLIDHAYCIPSLLMDATNAEDWKPNGGRTEKNPALLKTLDRLRYVAGIPP
jgi:hypothetical protein